MSYGALIRIAGLRAGSHDTDGEEIEVLSFHWGVSPLGAAETHPEIQEFAFVKQVDAASPSLFLRCRDRQRVPEAVFNVARVRGRQRRCLRYTFTGVLISSVRQGGSSQGDEEFPVEEVSLTFDHCELDYWWEHADGGVIGEVVHAAWGRPA
jgi:type VI secretion system secreted protein Hcp